MNKETNKGAREIKYYEYRVKATPEFVSPIEEGWEVVNVFIGWLPNGYVNYYIVFRKRIPKENIGFHTGLRVTNGDNYNVC